MEAVRSDQRQDFMGSARGLEWLSSAIELVYPLRCPICGTTGKIGPEPWCEACARRVAMWQESFCPRCRCFRPADFSDCDICHEPVHPTFVSALGAYDAALKNVVATLKYGGLRALAESVGTTLAENLRGFDAVETVVAVPTSPKKMRKRGFGHAEEIARHLAGQVGLPYHPTALFQVRQIADQTRLSAAARRANLDGAFAADPEEGIKDRTVLVVDDVMTTGVTLEEAARALTEAGARRVCAAIVALNLGAPQADLV